MAYAEAGGRVLQDRISRFTIPSIRVPAPVMKMPVMAKGGPVPSRQSNNSGGGGFDLVRITLDIPQTGKSASGLCERDLASDMVAALSSMKKISL